MKYENNNDKKKNVYDIVSSAGGDDAGARKSFPSEPEVPKVSSPQTVPAQQSAAPQTQQAQPQSPIQVDDIVDRILNREDFSFNLNGDAIYQQYADQYARMGEMAMMDTMGQAQAMTGGYGNSYAQTVGQQAYQNYMQGLNEAIPDLYQMALDRYMMEGDQMMQQYQIMADREAVAEEQRRYDQEWAAAHPEAAGGSGGGGGHTSLIADNTIGSGMTDNARAFMSTLPYVPAGGNVEGWKDLVAKRLDSSGLSDSEKMAIIYELGLDK